MTLRAAWTAAARRAGQVRLAAVPVLVALTLLIALQPPWNERLQSAWFDGYQELRPRGVVSQPATIVEIDQGSLARLGQWPWPRTLIAELVTAIQRQRPVVIGVDFFMPEPDALSPERLLARNAAADPELTRRVAALPANDEVLARALGAAPTVLVIAGSDEATGMLLRAPPFTVSDAQGSGDPMARVSSKVARHAGVLTSLDVLDRAAAGRGLVTVDPAGGVIRRVPLVASIDGTLVPALAIEMLRVAKRAPALRLFVDGDAVRGIGIGTYFVPTEGDGAVRVYYSRNHAYRYVSAIDVLQGRSDPARLEDKLVLVGVTGLGLVEDKNTPLRVPMPGVAIHAQLLENLFDGTLLRRPTWAPALEAVVFLGLGALLVVATSRSKPRATAVLALACVALLVGGGYAAFRMQRLLFDAATPGLGLLLLFGVLLVLTLAEATRQKKALERVVQRQREEAARVAGELDAAKRIQTGTLPRAELLRGDARIDLAAAMIPAREVGGDMYDFFRLDERRLFFLIGDVAGKGLSASIFMAVSKALCKSTMLRTPGADLGRLMCAANAEVSRDNAEMLFVTVFAGVLDLDTGDLAYCNAGHENPWLLPPAEAAVRRLEGGGGPPLCVVDDFDYRGAQCRMRPGELLCLVTDGVTEAQDADGELYGGARVERVVLDLRERAVSARAAVDSLCADVASFAAGTEPADDLTVLVLRWRGRGTVG